MTPVGKRWTLSLTPGKTETLLISGVIPLINSLYLLLYNKEQRLLVAFCSFLYLKVYIA